MKQTLTFEGTEEQIELLKAEFDMLRIEHTDEKLPKILKLFTEDTVMEVSNGFW